jgi:hypothetical protein
MRRFRRFATAAAFLTALLAATPSPAVARPWTTGFEDFGGRMSWRLLTWVARHWTPGSSLTNATANDGSKFVP